MAGPRSISRSTKVVATSGAGKHVKGKNKHKNRGKKKVPPLTSWDHDNSSAAESDDEEPTPAGAGKKRPREVVGRDRAQAQAPDDQRASVLKTSGDASKRKRVAGHEASGGGAEERSSSGSSSDDGEDGGADEGGGGRKGNSTPAVAAGGMGAVMARIIGQKLDTRVQAPVLAKRKTKTMKEMENASVKRAETRGKSAARRANMTQQFVIPDHTTTDYERQLKKIATRGVVALFNAISKRQNEGGASAGGAGGGSSGNNVAATAKATVVKGASRHAFLNMLKTGVKPTGGAAEAAAGAGVGSGGKRGGGSAGGGGGVVGEGHEDGGRSWSVLKEDYMMGASTMKNWDQDSADSEIDAIGRPSNDMSDEDSD
ncbi:unnamed protein product [Ectocarpus sp. CCAP 1310/34]|nr:unnamed protein product [Ectocarpus sp. CCAP 1310/34]